MLFRRRFKRVSISQHYRPEKKSKTIYYLNHSSWWDGLIPFLLNQKVFRQNARAMMEDKQMRQHSFFKKIGAFSVNLENPRAVIKSLRYAVESFERPESSLFIYPEGEIVPFSSEKPSFKKGVAWIAQKCPEVDVVPIGIYIHTAKADKPELFIMVGEKLQFDSTSEGTELNIFFEEKLGDLLKNLVKESHSKSNSFSRLI
ncbi:MAG: lysophospholipid acyltransferase family protein [Balneolaceae bacterium]|nr:lysophospholipid acyltransferase family protein [Balneolaceae bacterium]